jgi:hypothetical protein
VAAHDWTVTTSSRLRRQRCCRARPAALARVDRACLSVRELLRCSQAWSQIVSADSCLLSCDQSRNGSRQRGRMQECDVCCFTVGGLAIRAPSALGIIWLGQGGLGVSCMRIQCVSIQAVHHETMVTGSDNRLEGTPALGAIYPTTEACNAAPSRCYQYLCCGDVSIVIVPGAG